MALLKILMFSQLTLNSRKTETIILRQHDLTQILLAILNGILTLNQVNGNFSSDKEEIEFDSSDRGDYEWEIDRLTNKQLWVEDEYGNEYKWKKIIFNNIF